jgi:hypothetical protein
VDLKRINYEYQEKKESSKVKQETKIINQEPVEDTDIDEDEIINVILSDQLRAKRDGACKWASLSGFFIFDTGISRIFKNNERRGQVKAPIKTGRRQKVKVL